MDMLLFQLEKKGDKPLYDQLYCGIKEAIITKKITVGEKLPSKRKLADFLSISQTTIEIAYAQLLAEGYITSKPRIGYFVEEIDDLPYIQKEVTSKPNEQPKRSRIPLILILVPSILMLSLFKLGVNTHVIYLMFLLKIYY